MIPNIHNKAVFENEFDLEKSQILYKTSDNSHIYYKVRRNSDLLEYSLVLIDYKHSSSYNNFLQNVLNMIPLTKSGYFLELYTIYAWEHQKSPKIAILMEKFDDFLITHEFMTENELFETLGKTLKLLINNNNNNSHYFLLENLVIRNKTVKLLALDLCKNDQKLDKFLLLEQNSNAYFLSQIIDFFRIKNQSFQSPKTIKVLDVLSSNPGLAISNTNLEILINPLLEDFFSLESSTFIKNQVKTLSFAPNCSLCDFEKKSAYFCKSPDCFKPFCSDCLKIHKKTHHSKEIQEFEEFLKNEITAGDSLKLLEDLLSKIPDLDGSIDGNYKGLIKEIEKFFGFLDSQISKVLNAKKTSIIEAIERNKEEDQEKLKVIEKELSKQRKELVKLRETNELKTPYLQEDLDKIMPFLSEFRFSFHGDFLRKIEDLKRENMRNRDFVGKLMQRNSEFSNIMLSFAGVLENILKFPNAYLENLDIERLRNAVIEVKPVFYAKNPENSRVSLINMEEKGFLGIYEPGNKARIMNTASFNQDFNKGLLKNNGFLINAMKIRPFTKERILILIEKGFIIGEILEQEKIAIIRKIEGLEAKKFIEIEGFSEENLVFLGCSDSETIHCYSLDTDQWLSPLNLLKSNKNAHKTINNENSIGKIAHITILRKIDNESLLSISSNNVLRLWDINKRQILRTFNCEFMVSSLIAINPEEIAIGSQNNKIIVFSLTSFKEIKVITETAFKEDILISLEYSRKLNFLIACFAEKGLILWDIEKYYSRYQVKPIFPLEKSEVFRFSAICWAKKDEVLACGTENGEVFIVDLAWEMKKTGLGFLGNNRQRSIFSKHSSDMTDMFEEIKEFTKEKEEFKGKEKKRKISVMETKKIEVPGIKRSMDDSIFETAKAKIWMGKDKRKGSSICRMF